MKMETKISGQSCSSLHDNITADSWCCAIFGALYEDTSHKLGCSRGTARRRMSMKFDVHLRLFQR